MRIKGPHEYTMKLHNINLLQRHSFSYIPNPKEQTLSISISLLHVTSPAPHITGVHSQWTNDRGSFFTMFSTIVVFSRFRVDTPTFLKTVCISGATSVTLQSLEGTRSPPPSKARVWGVAPSIDGKEGQGV
jgi:hypothetical protein